MLVNIFAGINRCDWVAQGVVQAARETQLTVPLVVRLAGTNVEEGREILQDSGLPIIMADTLAEAADEASLPSAQSREAEDLGRERTHEHSHRREDAASSFRDSPATRRPSTPRRSIAYGTNVVGGVTPGKAGPPPRPSGVQHRQGGRAGDRRDGEHRLRARRLLRRLDHGGGRTRGSAWS